jgi:uncharacterized protein (DUF362 family)
MWMVVAAPTLQEHPTHAARFDMNHTIDRREFVKRCVLSGAGLVATPTLAGVLGDAKPPATYDLCAVQGDRYFENTLKAVDALGGMQKFVRPGQSVGILMNSPFDSRGAHTNPDVSLAVVKMCLDAGAKTIHTIYDTEANYWRRSRLFESMKSEIGKIRYSDDRKQVAIDKAKSLKHAEISTTLLSCDVFINIPIVKDHEGTRFSGNLKNMMGACSGSSCRQFHLGESSGILSVLKGYYSNIDLLAQSIADVNLVRQPQLCLVDATEILATNGPSGPGEIRKPREVIASTNCLAADMYAVRHLGLNWEDLSVIRCAQKHGYGPSSLQEVHIRNI